MRPFSLLIKPAGADCNLRCEYCFYLGRKDLYPGERRPRMSEAVLERLLRSYLALDQPVHAFCWQGGEPTLMGLDFFRRVTGMQSEFGRPGTTIYNSLQTNGLLLDDAFAAHLAEYRFLVGLSLDGPAEIHDAYRRAAGGRGSHAAAMRAARTLEARGVAFNAMTVVSKANATRAKDTYKYLRDNGFPDHQYIPCVEFGPDGEPAPFSLTGANWGRFLLGIFEAWYPADVGTVSIRHFEAFVARLAGLEDRMCTLGADCRGYFMVEHNGDVFPCDFHAWPEWKLGNVTADAWEDLLSSERYAAFGARKSELDPSCLDCRHFDLCAGDCPRNRRRNGRGFARSWLCEGWKIFFDETRPVFEKLAAGLNDRPGA